MLPAAQDAFPANSDFTLHLSLAVVIVTEAKEPSGCQFLHAFPPQSSLGRPIHTTGLLFPLSQSPGHTQASFVNSSKYHHCFPEQQSLIFSVLQKERKRVTFPKNKKINKSTWQKCFLFLFTLHCEFATSQFIKKGNRLPQRKRASN